MRAFNSAITEVFIEDGLLTIFNGTNAVFPTQMGGSLGEPRTLTLEMMISLIFYDIPEGLLAKQSAESTLMTTRLIGGSETTDLLSEVDY